LSYHLSPHHAPETRQKLTYPDTVSEPRAHDVLALKAEYVAGAERRPAANMCPCKGRFRALGRCGKCLGLHRRSRHGQALLVGLRSATRGIPDCRYNRFGPLQSAQIDTN
jgi:hypothetical protein